MTNVSANNFNSSMFSQADKTDLLVKSDKSNYIVMSEKKYRSLIETAYLNSIPGMAETIIQGLNTPSSDLAEVDWKNEL